MAGMTFSTFILKNDIWLISPMWPWCWVGIYLASIGLVVEPGSRRRIWYLRFFLSCPAFLRRSYRPAMLRFGSYGTLHSCLREPPSPPFRLSNRLVRRSMNLSRWARLRSVSSWFKFDGKSMVSLITRQWFESPGTAKIVWHMSVLACLWKIQSIAYRRLIWTWMSVEVLYVFKYAYTSAKLKC